MTIDEAAEKVQTCIDEVSGPEHMTKMEYKEFLETVISNLECNLDCVRHELETDDDDD